MTNVKRPKEPESRTRRLLPGEFEQLMIATQYDIDIPPESKSERIGAAIVFAIETAMRAGEICGITWEDVNLERRTVHLPKTKNGNPRTVPLSTTAVTVINDRGKSASAATNPRRLPAQSLQPKIRLTGR